MLKISEKKQRLNTCVLDRNQRGRDIGVFITLVPKFHGNVFLVAVSTMLGTFNEF